MYSGPVTVFTEEAFFFELAADASGRSNVMLRNAAGDRGLSLSFPKQQLPCFTLWKNTQAEADGFVTGLEPGTNYPNLKTFERDRGRVIQLQPGESYQTSIEMRIHDSADAVTQVEEQIQSQQSPEPQQHAVPITRFSQL